MLLSIIDYLKKTFNHPLTRLILRCLSLLSIISSAVTLGGFLIYTIGYSFLYGYYFSGDAKSEVSLIDLLIRNVPFSFYTIMVTSVIFLLVVAAFVTSLNIIVQSSRQIFIKGEREQGLIKLLMTIIFFMVFHIAVTAFFVGGLPSPTNHNAQFGYIWVGPFLLAIFIFCLNRYFKGLYSSLSGLLYGFITIILWSVFNHKEISGITVLSLIPVAVIFSFLEQFIRFTFYRAILWFPLMLTLVSLLTILPLVPDPRSILGWTTIILLSILLSILLAFRFGNPKRKRVSPNGPSNINGSNQSNQKWSGSGKLYLFIAITGMSFFSSCIPSLSALTGTYFRMLNPELRRATIVYDGGKTISNAALVAKKEDTYYISGPDWNLIILKADQLRINHTQ